MQATAKKWGAVLRGVWGNWGWGWLAGGMGRERALGGRWERFDLDDYLEIPTYIRRGQAGIIRQG